VGGRGFIDFKFDSWLRLLGKRWRHKRPKIRQDWRWMARMRCGLPASRPVFRERGQSPSFAARNRDL